MNGRRSSRVQLVALGTVVLGGCSGDEIPANRWVYPDRTACISEWGERNCSSGASSGGASVGLGPRYGSWINLPSGEKIYSGTPNMPGFHPQTGKQLGAAALSVSRSGATAVASAGSSAGSSSGSGSSSSSSTGSRLATSSGGSVSRGGFGSSGASFSSGG